jgi:hypothetical protein
VTRWLAGQQGGNTCTFFRSTQCAPVLQLPTINTSSLSLTSMHSEKYSPAYFLYTTLYVRYCKVSKTTKHNGTCKGRVMLHSMLQP